MDFKNGSELLYLCRETGLPISEIMKRREMELSGMAEDGVEIRIGKALAIMDASAHEPLEREIHSMGGLIGGEARKLEAGSKSGLPLCGSVITKAITYAMAVLEVNASMGLIVAAPTAGSSGVLPGVLFALKEEYGWGEEILRKGLYTAGAVGYLLMRNASVSGAQAGCQAEVGSASAMAAAAAVEMAGGTPDQAMSAAVGALSNLLGLVCDPIGGLVENPCQNRNAAGAVNALINAQQALAGIRQRIPFDEMAQVMLNVGRSMPFELKESALGGCALAPSVCSMASDCCSRL
jgi:L-serine dehydratase